MHGLVAQATPNGPSKHIMQPDRLHDDHLDVQSG